MKGREEEIFEAAITAFRQNFTTVPIRVDTLGTETKFGAYIKADKLVRLTIGERQIQYFAEIKNNFTKATIGLLLQHRNALPGPMLLVANYVNGVQAEQLRENKIDFIDAAGNAHINQPPAYIFVRGGKPKDEKHNLQRGRAFQPAGLMATFAFLCDPELINKNYRKIARATGIALGNIGLIIDDLKTQGFLIDKGNRLFKLIQKKLLLERFVEEYPKKLRPRLLLGQFRGNHDWEEQTDAHFANALWGGEAAAARLDKYLKPQYFTIYIKRGHLNEFLLENRLKREADGNVEILRIFWETAAPAANNGLVHPFLIYADLIATARQRNIEAAKVLYERNIERLIGED